MVTYNKMREHEYACLFNNAMIGHICQEVDGFYYFWPIMRGGFWEASVLRDIAHKLDGLNEAWSQKLGEMGVAACTEFTPPTPPKK